MGLVVEVDGRVELQGKAHVGREVLAVEVVVPHTALRHHEEPKELVRQDQLNLLEHLRGVVLRLSCLVLVELGPLHTCACQLVEGQTTRTSREAARGDGRRFGVPVLVGDEVAVLLGGSEGGKLVGLGGGGVDPAKRLHVPQVRVVGRLMGQSHRLVVSDLRHQHDAADLFDLRVVWRGHAIHVASDLDSQVRYADEPFEDVFGQDVSIADLLEVFAVHVDVVGAEVHVGCADGSDAPVGLGGELFFFVLAQSSHHHVLTVHIGRL